ncbi:DUF805 domain-containing protein [Cryobacterium sp. TMT3-29-2]|uniref:DUF805 domain-containing protein n=1 Tax=Cryobacterium sp. TMT3-29-2 TaxID=2555867 RepID=UPI001073ECC2|nr:DUF805 domain-containing protein [Cryobacterium sp. TMT3-29-2]TFC89922.1 DUF805 domain-containing protein [Cryobacterium sp. TMT3-29-2]
MAFLDSIRAGFRNYANFSGTAARSEFWWWVLFTELTGAAVYAITDVAMGDSIFLGSAWALAVLLPSLAVAVRRLRDAAFSWGHLFWLLMPFVGVIIIAILCAQPSAPRPIVLSRTTAKPLAAYGAR